MANLNVGEQIVIMNQRISEINESYNENLKELKNAYIDFKTERDNSLIQTKEETYKANIDNVLRDLTDLKNVRIDNPELFDIKNADIDEKISELKDIREYWETSGDLRNKNEQMYLASKELKEVNYNKKLDTYSVSIFLLFSIATMGVVIKKLVKMP